MPHVKLPSCCAKLDQASWTYRERYARRAGCLVVVLDHLTLAEVTCAAVSNDLNNARKRSRKFGTSDRLKAWEIRVALA